MIHHYATFPEFFSNFTVTSTQKLCLRSKKPLPLALHRRRHHSTVKVYKNWCNAMTSGSTIGETMSKISVRYVYQMAIYMVCNIVLFFLNSPSELTFWITYVYDTPEGRGFDSRWCHWNFSLT